MYIATHIIRVSHQVWMGKKVCKGGVRKKGEKISVPLLKQRDILEDLDMVGRIKLE
jgi:hypothetical protein